ncbi:hypothetical protein [uncultured Paraglaciecola sp.]|uniref:hypothetical protein n=1 Tax=uncultured Paraglaciecola sp. TaxID=1765024 RepID=UPI002618140C|nr:hypothetical protein [uncultured Paraglaciecola sp.]
MLVLKRRLLIAIVVLLANGCTKNNIRQVLGSAVADGADTQVRYDPQACRLLQQRCVQGDFQTWQTSDKKVGCSCKKL